MCSFFFSVHASTEIHPYLHTLCLNDALPISTFPSDMTARPVSTTLRFNRAQAAGDRCLCARVVNRVDRAQKAELVPTLHDTFAEFGVVVVTRNLGLTVTQFTDPRAKTRDAGASLKVTKNRLARIAVRGTAHNRYRESTGLQY